MDVLIALIAATLLILIIFRLFPALFSKKEKRTRDVMGRILSESGDEDTERKNAGKAAIRNSTLSDNEALDEFLRKIPGIESTQQRMISAGMKTPLINYLIGVAVFFIILNFVLGLTPLPKILTIIIAAVLSLWGSKKYLIYRKEKRNLNFINNFPEAVDMIVRSVRSGHPVSTAFGMIAENMEDPIGEEFKRVVDEVQYGRSMSEALNALSERVDEQDVRFFVVVLNVQQETGGNLGEVLTNLSTILRKRKQMRLKIHALTSEGRMTAYILGALPLFVIGVLQILSPTYLAPLFTESIGIFILCLALCMIGAAFLIVRRMVKIDI